VLCCANSHPHISRFTQMFAIVLYWLVFGNGIWWFTSFCRLLAFCPLLNIIDLDKVHSAHCTVYLLQKYILGTAQCTYFIMNICMAAVLQLW